MEERENDIRVKMMSESMRWERIEKRVWDKRENEMKEKMRKEKLRWEKK